jgi:hypothetical protein
MPESELEIKGKEILPEVIGSSLRNFALHAIPSALLFCLSLLFYEVLHWPVPAIVVTGLFAAAAIFLDTTIAFRVTTNLLFLFSTRKTALSRIAVSSMTIMTLVPLANAALDVLLIVRLIVVESR